MGKLALFLEGDCEKTAIRFYLQNNLSRVKITSDVIEFIKHDGQSSMVLLYDCSGYQNVLPKAKDYKDEFLWDTNIVLMRDLEKTPCFSSLANEITQAIPKLKDQNSKFGLFAAPCIEAVYQSDIKLFQNVMTKMYEETHGKAHQQSTSFIQKLQLIEWNNPLPSLSKFCKESNMAFKKVKIAENFLVS